MSDDAIDKINDAVRECLANCYGSDAPLASLSEFVERLRADPNWQPDEITQVEYTVQRVLSRLLRDDNDSTLSS